jgi:tetratricopeptide (TPR) repeat protein
VIVTLIACAMLIGGSPSTSNQKPQAAPSKPAAAIPDRATLLKQAAAAQQSGDYRQAARLLQLAAERYKSVVAYLELARLQSRSKDNAAALVSLGKARELAPNSEDVLSAHAQLALASKLPVPAVLTLIPLTRMYPSVAQYHYLLGVGLMALQDFPFAVDALEEANRLEPDRALTLLALGLSLNNRKMFAEARGVLTRSLELQPESSEALAALAEAEAGAGDLDSATVHARKALETAPASATAHLVIGLVALEHRSYEDARAALLDANKADPDSAKILYQLSQVYARLGDEVSSRRYVNLYQQKLRSIEEQLNTLRSDGALLAARLGR